VERCPRCGAQQITCACLEQREPQAFPLANVLDACAMRLWEASQVPGFRRGVMTFKVPQGAAQRAVEVRLEVDEDGDVLWLAGDQRRLIVRADGESTRDG
jgi:hypothetical protein